MENVPDIPEREHVPDMIEHAPEKEACTLPDMEHVPDMMEHVPDSEHVHYLTWSMYLT